MMLTAAVLLATSCVEKVELGPIDKVSPSARP